MKRRRVAAFAADPALRRGDVGPEVAKLQARLASLGYSVGEMDGRFGYVTEDAVLRFQRDRRLLADGVAGARTMGALAHAHPGDPPVHTVQRGERLTEVAARHDVPVSALRWTNNLGRTASLRPGRRLHLWRPYILAGLHPSAVDGAFSSAARRPLEPVSGFAAPLACLNDGSLGGSQADLRRRLLRAEGEGFIALHGGERPLSDVLLRRGNRRRLVDALAALCKEAPWRGLVVESDRLPVGGGAALDAFCLSVRRAVPGRAVILSLPPPGRGWNAFIAGTPPAALAAHVDRVIVGLHHWERLVGRDGAPLGFEEIEGRLLAAFAGVPPWKLWLGAPLGGCLIEGSGRAVRAMPLTHRDAVGKAYRQAVRPTPDASGFLRQPQSGGGTLIMQGRASFERMMQMALRRRLARIYLHPVCGDEQRLLQLLRERVPPGRRL